MAFATIGAVGLLWLTLNRAISHLVTMPKSLFSFAFAATLACFVLASFADKHGAADFLDFSDSFSADLEGRDSGDDGYGLPPPYDYGTPVVVSTVTSTVDGKFSFPATTLHSPT